MILILILIILIALVAFGAGPALLNYCVDVYDEWIHAIHRIQRRRDK